MNNMPIKPQHHKGFFSLLRLNISTGGVLLTLSTIILIITIALPMILIIYNTFFYEFTFDWQLFSRVIFQKENIGAMYNTVKIAFLVTIFWNNYRPFFCLAFGKE